MAWRLNELLIEGELDNTVQNKVTGWIRLAGMKERIEFDLEGNFHRDIRGARVKLSGDGKSAIIDQAQKYLAGFSHKQSGKVGDMTAGLPPYDYTPQGDAYFEWYGDENGRCVIELDTDQVELLSQPIPACESDPISREQQAGNMAEFLCGIADELGIPRQMAVSTGDTAEVEQAKKTAFNNARRLKCYKSRNMQKLNVRSRPTAPCHALLKVDNAAHDNYWR
jgi:hypothetical protein